MKIRQMTLVQIQSLQACPECSVAWSNILPQRGNFGSNPMGSYGLSYSLA